MTRKSAAGWAAVLVVLYGVFFDANGKVKAFGREKGFGGGGAGAR